MMKNLVWTVSIALCCLIPVTVSAELIKGECPLSCDVVNTEDTVCSHWKIGSTCYVSIQDDSNACDKKKKKNGKKGKGNAKKDSNKKKTKGKKNDKKKKTTSTSDRKGKKRTNVARSNKNKKERAQGSGSVSSEKCPYSCDSNGLSKEVCRDWKEGDTCFVEDLR